MLFQYKPKKNLLRHVTTGGRAEKTIGVIHLQNL